MRAFLYCMVLLSAHIAAAADQSLLDILEQRLSQHARTSGAFVQTAHVAILSEPVVSLGRFYVDRDLGISWHVDVPISASYQFRERSDVDARTSMRDPLQWVGRILNSVFTTELDSLTDIFEVAGAAEQNRWHLILTPKAVGMKRFIDTIQVEGADAIDSIVIRQAGGDSIDIAFWATTHPDRLPAEILDELRPLR